MSLLFKLKPQSFKAISVIANRQLLSARKFQTSSFFCCKNEPTLNNSGQKFDKILTVPNFLTLTRIVSTPVISYLLISNMHTYAFYLFLAASVTDFADGQIARRFPSQQSRLGSILDPFADKFLVGTMVLTMAYTQMMPMALVSLIIGRDLVLLCGSWWILKKNKGKPIEIQANQLSKWNTALQLTLITLTIPAQVYGYADSSLLALLQYSVAFTTVASGLSYLRRPGYNKISEK